MNEEKPTPYNKIGSALGNGIYSTPSITIEQLWETLKISENEDDFDAAMSALIRLNEIAKGKNND